MRYITFSRTLVAMLVMAVTTPLLAADPAISGRGPVPFETYDADGNGYVSQKEFERVRTERIQSRAQQQYQMRNMNQMPDFSSLDGDGDGRLNRAEIQAHQRERQEMRQQNRMERQQGGGSGMGRGAGPGGMGGGKR